MRITSTTHRFARGVVFAATIGALLVGPADASADPPSAARSLAASARPTIAVTLNRSSIVVSAHGVRAGWAAIEVTGRGSSALVVRFSATYDIDAFTADWQASQGAGRSSIEAFERLMDGTTFLGGARVGGTARIKLPRAGTYTVLELYAPRGIKSATFEAGSRSPETRRPPATDGSVQAVGRLSLDVPATLPHEGRLMYANRGEQLPHTLVLQRVREGTTPKEYAAWMYSNEFGDFNLEGSLETPYLSPRRRMAVDYNLPRGQYAVMCFVTDPKTRVSHVFAGELRMIHLR